MTTVEPATIRAAVRDGVARGVAAIGLAGVALIHLLDLPGQLREKYVGFAPAPRPARAQRETRLQAANAVGIA